MTIQAIETSYNGYRFRSRLEARWAVFFNAISVVQSWNFTDLRYEHEGYDLGDFRYLPDFQTIHEDRNIFFEIKPTTPSSEERNKAQLLANQSSGIVVIIAGDPWYTTPLYMFNDIRSPDTAYWGICLKCNNLGFLITEYNDEPAQEFVCSYCTINWCCDLDYEVEHVKKHPLLMTAYTAARSARFEHGETPKIKTPLLQTQKQPRKTDDKKTPTMSKLDLLIRYHTIETLLIPSESVAHINKNGKPLCSPDNATGFNLKAWIPVKADVLVENICKRCLRFSITPMKTRAERYPTK